MRLTSQRSVRLLCLLVPRAHFSSPGTVVLYVTPALFSSQFFYPFTCLYHRRVIAQACLCTSTPGAMRMQQPNSPYNADLEQYANWLKANRAVGFSCDGGQALFVPLGAPQKYLKQAGHIRQLLAAVTKSTIRFNTVRDYLPNTFTILLLIGKGTYIEHFLNLGDFSDSKLPLAPQQPDGFACLDEASFQEFQAQQWQFCAPLFDSRLLSCPTLSPDCILPITSKRRIAEGGSAFIYEIGLHSDHDRLGGRDTVCRALIHPTLRSALQHVWLTTDPPIDRLIKQPWTKNLCAEKLPGSRRRNTLQT